MATCAGGRRECARLFHYRIDPYSIATAYRIRCRYAIWLPPRGHGGNRHFHRSSSASPPFAERIVQDPFNELLAADTLNIAQSAGFLPESPTARLWVSLFQPLARSGLPPDQAFWVMARLDRSARLRPRSTLPATVVRLHAIEMVQRAYRPACPSVRVYARAPPEWELRQQTGNFAGSAHQFLFTELPERQCHITAGRQRYRSTLAFASRFTGSRLEFASPAPAQTGMPSESRSAAARGHRHGSQLGLSRLIAPYKRQIQLDAHPTPQMAEYRHPSRWIRRRSSSSRPASCHRALRQISLMRRCVIHRPAR